MKNKKIPLRTCVVTKEKLEKRINILAKIKYRLAVSENMIKSLE